MQGIWDIAWHRFQVIQGVVADGNARIIAVFFYFSILVPFGLGYSVTGDPFMQKTVTKDGKTVPAGQAWHDRDPVPNDINSARQQG